MIDDCFAAGLTVLNLSNDELKETGRYLQQLTTLTRLTLCGNRLRRLDGLGSLHGLVEIKAARNQIASVDFSGLRALQVFPSG